jgi:hypothetical protein
MADSSALAMTALILDVVVVQTLIQKGITSQNEIKEKLDATLLLLEQSGLILGDEGKAVHTNLEGILMIFSGADPSNPPVGT